MAGNDAAIEAVRNVLSRLRKRRGLRSNRLERTEIDAAALLGLRVIGLHADRLGLRRQDAVVPVIREMVRRMPPTDRLIADAELALGLLDDAAAPIDPAGLYAEDLGARRDYLCAHWRPLHEAVHAETIPPAPTVSQLRRNPEHRAFAELARLLVEGTSYGSHPLDTAAGAADTGVRGRVTVVGDAVIDHLYRVERIPPAHGTVTGSFIAHPGGKGLARAVALARLGIEVHLMAAIGEDEAGHRILDFLHEQQVRTDLIKIVPNTPTPVTAVIVAPSGEQATIACKADPAALGADDLTTTTTHRALTSADAVLMSFEQPVPILEQVLATLGALESRPTLIVHAAPPVTRPERLYPHLRVVDYLIGTSDELSRLTGTAEAAWQLRMHGVQTVCTIDDFGCSVRSDRLTVDISPFPTLLTGSPGAHAAFSAALAYRLLRSRQPADTGDFRWATAAMVATQSLDDVPSAMPPADRIDHIVKLASEEH